MKVSAYGLGAIVAWPAVAWCAVEAGLRVVDGHSAGAGQLALADGCAAAAMVAVHVRRAALAPAAIAERDRARR